MGHRPTPEFPAHLNALYRGFPFERSLARDPLSLVRPLARDARNAEVAGLFAATLAVGNTTAIRGAFADLMERAGRDPAGFLGLPLAERRRRLAGFRHRWIRDDQLVRLSSALVELADAGESLESVFVEGRDRTNEFAGGLDALAHRLRSGGGPGRRPAGYARLFPSPLDRSRSACKRLTLLMRWLVRPEYPDLGVWRRVAPRELRVPLDQHVFWISYHLGLTPRRTRNWPAVEEVTAALREVDPMDPVKFDFVLCHTGVSGDCPKERDIAVCGPCVVRPDCLLWRRSSVARMSVRSAA